MDNYSNLLKAMADAFITTVRVLETENAHLRSEVESLRIELDETQAGTDQWYDWRDELDREEMTGL